MSNEKSVASIPPRKRRYDSIAILLQGDAVCGASCFDGKNVLLATNEGEKTAWVNEVLLFLKKIAQKCSEKSKSVDYSKWVGAMKRALLDYAKKQSALFQQNKTYASRFQSALDKITYSLELAYQRSMDPRAFPFKMAEIIRKGEFKFLEKNPIQLLDRIPHAEMQIVDYLYANSPHVFGENEPVYIGVSKKCCGNCETAIQALNQVMLGQVVTVRGEGHGFNFLAGIPEFLKANREIEAIFLRMRAVETLEKAFVNDSGRISGQNQLLSPSSSVYESVSIHESYELSQGMLSVETDESSEVVIPFRAKSTGMIMKQLTTEPEKPKPQNQSSKKNANSSQSPAKKKKARNPKIAASAPALLFATSGKPKPVPQKSAARKKKPAARK